MKKFLQKYIWSILVFSVIFGGLPFLLALITMISQNDKNIIEHLKWWSFIVSFVVGIIFFVVITAWKENKKLSSIRKTFWTEIINFLKKKNHD